MITAELPQRLREEFERTAQSLYGRDSVTQALIEAVELWLARHREPPLEEERTANDRAYEALRAELEQRHSGKWIVMAHGKLQGVGDSLEEVDQLASTAHDRIVMRVGEKRSKEIEVGWQMTFA